MGYVFPLEIPRISVFRSFWLYHIQIQFNISFTTKSEHHVSFIIASIEIKFRGVRWCVAQEFLGEHLAVLVFVQPPGQTSNLVKCRWIIAEVHTGGFSCFYKCLCQPIRVNIPGRAIFPDSGIDHEISAAYQSAAIDYSAQT